MEENKNNEEELPKLTLKEENEFKRLKLSLESNTFFLDFKTQNLPPEIEGLFLDNIINFQKAFENAKKISIYERIGKPIFYISENLSELEIKTELNKIIKLLFDFGIGFNTKYKYKNKLIYDFVTTEFFDFEVEDIQIGNMIMHFSYENFYPNYIKDIKKECKDFWKALLNGEHQIFNKNKDTLKNGKQLLLFYESFDKFKINAVKAKDVSLDIENELATATVELDFEGFLKGEKNPIHFKGISKIELINNFGWEIVFASIL